MAVDRAKVKKQMAASKSRSGKFRYLAKDTTTALRIIEFKDADDATVFAHPLAEHRDVDAKGGKALGICREETFGKPCAFCRINQKHKDAGEDWAYTTKTRYAVNGIDINDSQLQMRLWVLPVTAYDQIAEYTIDDEWADILEPKGGSAFNCKREGSGLDTVYSVKPQRKPYPVNKELMKNLVNPLDQIPDPGLEAQCEELGYEVSDLFDDSELEVAGGDKKSAKKSAKKDEPKANAKKSKSKKSKKKDDDEIGEGSAVLFEDEDVVYHVASIDGDDVEIEDDDGNLYDATMDQLKPVPDEESEPKDAEPEDEEPAPIDVGSEVKYLDEDGICTVKSIDGDDVVIEDADGEQYDAKMEELSDADIPF